MHPLTPATPFFHHGEATHDIWMDVMSRSVVAGAHGACLQCRRQRRWHVADVATMVDYFTV